MIYMRNSVGVYKSMCGSLLPLKHVAVAAECRSTATLRRHIHWNHATCKKNKDIGLPKQFVKIRT